MAWTETFDNKAKVKARLPPHRSVRIEKEILSNNWQTEEERMLVYALATR